MSSQEKCDQAKPICLDCDRLRLKCEYPDPNSLEDRRKRGGANSRWSPKSKSRGTSPTSIEPSPPTFKTDDASHISETESSTTSNTFTIQTSYFGILSTARIFLRSTREIQLLSSYCDFFVPANILPNAHANFSRLCVGEAQELKDTIFACSSIQIANKYGSVPVEALDYYTRAVSGVRRKLDAGVLTGREDWLLLTTILLHCFETWRCDVCSSTPMTFQHLLGAIQLLKLRCQNPLVEEIHHDLYVLMAESVLFHVSTLLISNPSFATLDIDSSLWDWIEIILVKPVYESHPPPARHPILGTPRKLNRLIFEISKLRMRPSFEESDLQEIQRLDAELRQWEDDQELFAEDVGEDPYLEVRELYIICARILLLVTLTTVRQVSESVLEHQKRRHVLRGLDIIRNMESADGEMWNFLMRWPLRVLCWAVENGEEEDVVRESLRRIWDKSACGDVKRTLCELESEDLSN
ncbi:hypothetical protein BKA64DRAFT_725054 [Cadophora sp. MPI-SDFR-AT-0126]|nr:hypothetical protein BKA64DRAFT_725054 [Leotiomycetes sp. MPI-SDFR-AT-0126]